MQQCFKQVRIAVGSQHHTQKQLCSLIFVQYLFQLVHSACFQLLPALLLIVSLLPSGPAVLLNK